MSTKSNKAKKSVSVTTNEEVNVMTTSKQEVETIVEPVVAEVLEMVAESTEAQEQNQVLEVLDMVATESTETPTQEHTPSGVELIETTINQLFETLGDKVPTEEVSTYKDTLMQLISNTIEQVQANKQHIVAANKGVTKADIARRIFEEERPNGLIRKVVLERLQKEAGLTKGGASTYLHNYRLKEGLVIHR